MPQDLAAGSFNYTVQPTTADTGKLNRIGRRVRRYHNLRANKRLFMQSGAKPSEMHKRLGAAGAKAMDTRGTPRDIMGKAVTSGNLGKQNAIGDYPRRGTVA